MKRREFINSMAGAGGGLLILPSGTLFGQNTPSNKLNIALVGVWGRGTAHYRALQTQNVVALCDTNEDRLAQALPFFPKAKTYWDWRKLLDQKDVEAVMICAADHHHSFISNWALNRGLHVYCEKPVGISVAEVRAVRANYIKQKAKLATQHGTQRHAYANFQRLRELVLDGAIGDLKTVSGWDSRQGPRPGYPAGQGEPPASLHWDQWVGPSPFHPYTPQYFGGTNGYNCLYWNMYRDFGVGQIGDMGSHTMDILWNVIDAGAPTAIEVDQEVSDPFDRNICPVKLKVSFEHPKNSWRGPVTLVWYQGGLKPNPPRRFIDITRIPNGVLLEGTKGSILADFTGRLLIPNNDDGDLTYYKRRSKEQLLPLIDGTGTSSAPVGPPPSAAGRAGAAPAGGPPGPGPSGPDGFPIIEMLPSGLPPALGLPTPPIPTTPQPVGVDAFQQEWFDACRGKLNHAVHGTSSKTHCDLDYAGTMIEQMLLGLVAHRIGKRLEYDAVAGRITNAPEANDYLTRPYRPGWTLNG